MRTRAIGWFLGLVLGAALRAGAEEQAAKPAVLTILNWPTYLDPGLVDKFEKQEQVEIRELFFETDADRDVIMMENEGRGCDLVLVDDSHVAAYVRQGWLQPLRSAEIPNLVHLDEAWRDAFPGAREYGVPYAWGVLGIVYRADQVKSPPRRWMDLFRPAEDIQGRILMIEDPKELIGMALKALGRDANSGRREDLEAADRLLQEQKPFVGEYSYIMTSTNSQLLGNGISVAMAYNGDALAVGSLSTNLVFVYPAEGSVMFCDFWCVPRYAAQPELARKFLNFLQEPAQAARAAQYIHFATPNKAAEKILPPSFLTNRGVYPSSAYLEKCVFLKELGGSGQNLRNRIFARITGEAAAP